MALYVAGERKHRARSGVLPSEPVRRAESPGSPAGMSRFLARTAEETAGGNSSGIETAPAGLLSPEVGQAAGNNGIQSSRRAPFAEALQGRRAALAEGVASVSPLIQSRIDAEKPNGGGLDSQSREELEPLVAADLSDVRLHRSPAAVHLSRDLGARAFTQGRDVFLGAHTGNDTLAHEVTHAARRMTGSGTIQRQPVPQPDQDQSHPSSVYRPLNDVKTVKNSTRRLDYAQFIAQNSREAVENIRQARQMGDLRRAEQLARDAHAFRTDLRMYTRERISPGAVALSEAVEHDRSWPTLMEKYQKPDPFDTYESIAAASGRTNELMTDVANVGAVAGAAMFAWDVVAGTQEIVDAPAGERLRVASEVIGGNLGSYGGAEAGTALGAAGAAALLSNPGGWAILAGLGLGYLGGRFGGEAGAWVAGIPFRVLESIDLAVNVLPGVLVDTVVLLAQVMAMPFDSAGALIAGAPVRAHSSLDIGNWDLRYFPPSGKAAALAIGGTMWLKLASLDADSLMLGLLMPLAQFGVPEDAAQRLSAVLSGPDKQFTAQDLLAMKPMEFVDLLRLRELAFVQSPEYLQGWSMSDANVQFFERPLIRLRSEVDSDNWIVDQTSAGRARPLQFLGSALWGRLAPLNEKDFSAASQKTLAELGMNEETLGAAAQSIAEIMRSRSANGLPWDLEPDTFRDMTPQDFISFLIDNAGLDFQVPPDKQADAAVAGIKAGYAPW
jgi:Domain of unknown function (DUF4157)